MAPHETQPLYFNITQTSATIRTNGDFGSSQTFTISSDHPRWAQITAALLTGDHTRARELLDNESEERERAEKRAAAIASLERDVPGLKVDDVNRQIIFREKPMPSNARDYVFEIIEKGLPMEPLVRFFNKLHANPSYRSQQMALEMVVRNGLPIEPTGNFMAYKRIRSDWKDCHTGKIDNSIGQDVTMPRSEVDDNPASTCSSGLHACSKEYLKSFYGDRLVAVSINPRDVVCVPNDYNHTKMRVCRYTVVKELPLSTIGVEHWDSPMVDDNFEPIEADIASLDSPETGALRYCIVPQGEIDNFFPDIDIDDCYVSFQDALEERDITDEIWLFRFSYHTHCPLDKVARVA